MCGIGYFLYVSNVKAKKYSKAHKKTAHLNHDDEGFFYRNGNQFVEYLVGYDFIDELKMKEFFYNFLSTLKWFFQLLYKTYNYEGYLTVLVIRKKS